MYYRKKKWRLNFTVTFKKFSSLAYVPTKATPGSACFDIYSNRDVLLGPGVTKTVELNLGFQFSKTYVCRNYSISGLSLKQLSLGGGVIDSDYRGNISLIPANFSLWNVEIKERYRIRQIIFLNKEEVDFE